MDQNNRVVIFDTTLRDGEQSPGIALDAGEKLEIAHQLARLGVDVIEAGFPITSPGDFEAVEAISRQVEGPVIAGLARTHVADIDAAWGAVKDAERPRIHTFISTSDIHIEHQLQTTREDGKGQARAALGHARSYTEALIVAVGLLCVKGVCVGALNAVHTPGILRLRAVIEEGGAAPAG